MMNAAKPELFSLTCCLLNHLSEFLPSAEPDVSPFNVGCVNMGSPYEFRMLSASVDPRQARSILRTLPCHWGLIIFLLDIWCPGLPVNSPQMPWFKGCRKGLECARNEFT
jgi:hypothetical protein